MQLETITGRIVDLRRHVNVHRYGYRPLGPMERYELWIRQRNGAERQFTIDTRFMPARTGHEVSVIATQGRPSKMLAILNHTVIDGANYARRDAPPLVRVYDFLLLPLVFIAMVAKLSSAGVALFVPVAAAYLLAACVIRGLMRTQLIGRVYWAIHVAGREYYQTSPRRQ